MANLINLSELTTEQLKAIAWELRGTPQVQPVYRELSNRPAKYRIAPDDPNWEEKTQQAIKESLGI